MVTTATAILLYKERSPRITVSIQTALWNPRELPWQIILPWLRFSNRATESELSIQRTDRFSTLPNIFTRT